MPIRFYYESIQEIVYQFSSGPLVTGSQSLLANVTNLLSHQLLNSLVSTPFPLHKKFELPSKFWWKPPTVNFNKIYEMVYGTQEVNL
jgi:hypothetical protein